MTTLGSHCAVPTGSGDAGSAGASVGITCLKMSERALSDVDFSSLSCDNRSAGARFWRALMRSAAADAALSVEEFSGIFTWQGVNYNVLLMRSASVIHIQVQ